MTRVASRLSLSFLTYVLLLLAVVSGTAFVLRRQHDDGLVVNLSGRQRMLTQRMTHQLLTYASKIECGSDAHDAAERVHRTMRVFETTLNALSDGGPAPIDLQMAIDVRYVASRLNLKVRALRRRLTAEHSSITQLLDEARLRIAQRELSKPGASIKEVAHRLGFSEASAFHRSFKRLSGLAPAQFIKNRNLREQILAGRAARSRPRMLEARAELFVGLTSAQ